MTQPRNPYSIDACPVCGAVPQAGVVGGICTKCLLVAGLASEKRSGLGQTVGWSESFQSRTNGRRFDPPSPKELEDDFPELEVIELAGIGGMGVVYKARQRELDRIVALKILPPEVASDQSFAVRFAREARALAKLNHVNIVQVYQTGKNDKYFFILMEFVDGANLRQAIQKGNLQSHEALAIVPQICEALQYAHSNGIVHRDIKPENILVDKNGLVKVADFGLAKLVDTDLNLTATQQVMGTVHYMAPEQIRETSQVDHRADIYSLGVVFYEMLTGQLPLGKFAMPSTAAKIDPRLDSVVLRTLENEPDNRYQTASDIRSDIASFDQHPVALPAPVKSENCSVLLKRVQRLLLIPGLIILVVGLHDYLWGVYSFSSNLGYAFEDSGAHWLQWLNIIGLGVASTIVSIVVCVAGIQMIRAVRIPFLRVASLLLMALCMMTYSLWMRLGVIFGMIEPDLGVPRSAYSLGSFDVAPLAGFFAGIAALAILYSRSARSVQACRNENNETQLLAALPSLTEQGATETRRRMKMPSTLMMTTGILGLVCALAWISIASYAGFVRTFGYGQSAFYNSAMYGLFYGYLSSYGYGPLLTVLAILNLPTSLLMIRSGRLMRQVKEYKFNRLMGWLALIPLNPFLYPLNLLTGVWTLLALKPLTSKLLFLSRRMQAMELAETSGRPSLLKNQFSLKTLVVIMVLLSLATVIGREFWQLKEARDIVANGKSVVFSFHVDSDGLYRAELRDKKPGIFQSTIYRVDDRNEIAYLAAKNPGVTVATLFRISQELGADLNVFDRRDKPTHFELKNKHIVSLNGIQKLTMMESLEFRNCKSLTDISAIASLKKLKTIQLDGCNELDLDQIAELKQQLPDVSFEGTIHAAYPSIYHAGARQPYSREVYAPNEAKIFQFRQAIDLSTFQPWDKFFVSHPQIDTFRMMRFDWRAANRFKGCKNIRIAKLESCSIENFSFLTTLPNLEEVHFKCTEAELPPIAKKIPKLSKIEVETSDEDVLLGSIRGILPKLKHLSVTMSHSSPENRGDSISMGSRLNRRMSGSHLGSGNPNFYETGYSTAPKPGKNVRSSKLLAALANNSKLETLTLKNFEQIPEFDGAKFPTLKQLSIINCPNLTKLDLESNDNLERLSLSVIPHLQQAAVCGTSLQGMTLQSMQSLRRFKLTGDEPQSLGRLHLNWLPKLERIEGLNSSMIQSFKCWNCDAIKSLPDLTDAAHFETFNCANLQKIPRIEKVESTGDFEIIINNCPNAEFTWPNKLSDVTLLSVSGCNAQIELKQIAPMTKLKSLSLSGVTRLSDLSGIEHLEQIASLSVESDPSLKEISHLKELTKLKRISIKDCKNIQTLDGISKLQGLQNLDVSGCVNLKTLNGILNLKEIQTINVTGCVSLDDISAIENLEHLFSISVLDSGLSQKDFDWLGDLGFNTGRRNSGHWERVTPKLKSEDPKRAASLSRRFSIDW